MTGRYIGGSFKWTVHGQQMAIFTRWIQFTVRVRVTVGVRGGREAPTISCGRIGQIARVVISCHVMTWHSMACHVMSDSKSRDLRDGVRSQG